MQDTSFFNFEKYFSLEIAADFTCPLTRDRFLHTTGYFNLRENRRFLILGFLIWLARLYP